MYVTIEISAVKFLLCFNFSQRRVNLIKMKYVSCYVRNGNTKKHDGQKMAMWNLTHSQFIKFWIFNINIITNINLTCIACEGQSNAIALITIVHSRKRQEWGVGGSMKKVLCQRDEEREIHYLWKMCGYPQFSFWILIAIANICSLHIVISWAKIMLY